MTPRLRSIAVACCLPGGAAIGADARAATPAWAVLSSPAATTTRADIPGQTAQGGQGAPAPPDTASPCEQAGAAAEQANGLPPGLLLAIGRVESGKWDPARARMTPWPWALNAAGKGQWLETKDGATKAVRGLLGAGTRSIDVGCFQINLMYHPTAFADLEQAFDPDANARYASRFLLTLFGRTGTWEAAVAAYHSADPMLGFAYRQQVFSTWAAAPPPPRAAMAVAAASPRPKPRAMPEVYAGVQVWTPLPAGSGATIVAMPAPSGWDEPPHTTLTAAPLPPLPVVSYRAMPRR